jgi:hypothetical protein
MSDLDTFKRRVGYKVTADQDTFTGNGSNKTVQLRHDSVSDVQVSFGDIQQDAGLYTVNAEAGSLTFTDAPADGVVVTVFYLYAAFTDEQAHALISEYGLQLAVIEALRELLADTAKLRNYKQGDTEVDNSQVFKQVKQLLDMYVTEYQKDQSVEQAQVNVVRRHDPRGEDDCERNQDISRLLYG